MGGFWKEIGRWVWASRGHEVSLCWGAPGGLPLAYALAAEGLDASAQTVDAHAPPIFFWRASSGHLSFHIIFFLQRKEIVAETF